MRKSGIIFQAVKKTDNLEIEGLVGLLINWELIGLWKEIVRPVKRSLRLWGRGLVLGAMLVVLTTGFLPLVLGRQEAKRRLEQLKNQQITFSDLLRIEADKSSQVTEATYFMIEVPKIGAKAKVIANVDSGNKKEYRKALKEGVAHAAGTYLPGMGGGVTLFAHSTDISVNVGRYNAVFYRLDELKEGDQIVIWFLGERRVYRVVGSKIVGPSEVGVFEADKGGERLFLVTCTPRGTTINRLIVEAQLLTG